MLKRRLMSKREEELMNFLWEKGRPLTTAEMDEMLDSEHWSKISIYKTVQSLLNLRYLQISGFERSNTQYARKVEPALTKEEYAAKMLLERGMDTRAIGSIALAMVGNGSGSKKSDMKKKQMIQDLERIIEDIRSEEL